MVIYLPRKIGSNKHKSSLFTMLGVISTHEPIRGEFAKAVREMLKKSADSLATKETKKASKWVIKD